MDRLTLVIGTRNSSSWSLRAWLLLRQLGLAHQLISIPLRHPDTALRIQRYSPSGKVPVLLDGKRTVWDTLAIAEYLAERHPGLWPADPAQRALARSVSCEMHSGFSALRTFLPMDFTARFGPPGRLLATVEADVRRVIAIWAACRRGTHGAAQFLFGDFSIADAMFAPVCSRFTTYAVPLDPASQAYVDAIMRLPAMVEWGRLAAAELAGVPAVEEPAVSAVADEPAAPPPSMAAAAVAPPPPPPAPEPVPPPPPPAPEPVALPEPDPAPTPVMTAPPIPFWPPPAALPTQPPAELRRSPRPIPSTVMVKPIGDGTRRRR
jgi:glutathione S-transferase